MKVLFVKDKPPTALAGEVLEVRNGFARNFLVPQGLAVLATDAVLERSKDLMQKAAERRRLSQKEWQEVGDELVQAGVTVVALSSETGRLYGSVSRAAVATEVSRAVSREITPKQVSIASPIKAAGTHKVRVNLPEGIQVEVKVVVVPKSDGKQDKAPEETTEEVAEETDSENEKQ